MEAAVAAITGVTGIVGALAGALATNLFQIRAAERAGATARAERLREVRLDACATLAGLLTDFRRSQNGRWHRQRDDAGGERFHSARDADVAGAALVTDDHLGRAHTLGGPELISRREQVHLLAEALGEPVHLDVITRDEARERYRRQGGFAAANADFLLGCASYDGDQAEADTDTEPGPPLVRPPGGARRPTLADATGRPGRTFRRWALDHTADLQ